MWQPHQGHGACRGRRDSPCLFGEWSMPAPAAPSGYCDLCDAAMLASLHEALPARLTHVLNNLNQAVLEKGFLYVQEALGSSAEADYRARVVRARHRKAFSMYRKRLALRRRQTIVQELCELGIDVILLESVVVLVPAKNILGSLVTMTLVLAAAVTARRVFTESSSNQSEAHPPAVASFALDFVEKTIDNAAANDFKRRVLRARRRCDPERPKRKARGVYKKSDRRQAL
eukprot:s7406_g3.t1